MARLLTQSVDHWASVSPNNLAACIGEECLSYRQLADTSNALAHCLIGLGVQRGDRVGILMNKAIELPVAIYGILKAGAAYVPLDPSAPAARLGSIIEDCGICVVVTADEKQRLLRAILSQVTSSLYLVGVTRDFDCETVSWQEVRTHPQDAPIVKIIESDLAYIIYTSGSTGQPKGIMHTHQSGMSFARWTAEQYGFGVSDRLANTAPLHFDLSIMDFFTTSLVGAAVILIPEEYNRLPASYTQLIADQRVTVLYIVPSALIQILERGVIDERDLGAVRWVIFGGEPFSPKHLNALMEKLPDAQFDNIYGPAEVNGCAHITFKEPAATDRAIPVGPIGEIGRGTRRRSK